jgi:hypothetical protein
MEYFVVVHVDGVRLPRWNDIDREKPKNSEETCTIATLFTTNPTWTDPCANTR